MGNSPQAALRQMVVDSSKEFKTSWVNLGRVLYSVWKNKAFRDWGYEKFETYVTKEVGIRKLTAVKLLRSYFYLEREEPRYLKEDYAESTEAAAIPAYETVNVLRLAKDKKDLPKQEYMNLKKAVFEKGKDAPSLRKDLTQIMKQRRQIDPEQAREEKSLAAVKRFLTAFKSFKRDMETLKLVPSHLLREAEELMHKIEKETL